MNASELLGAVGAASLRERLTNESEGDGLARFMLDRLTGQQVAAVVQALLLDAETAKKVKIAVPRDLVAAFDLPEAVITDERTVALRHAECDRRALLLANTDDDQGASLQEVSCLVPSSSRKSRGCRSRRQPLDLVCRKASLRSGKLLCAVSQPQKTGRCIRSRITSNSRVA